MECYTGWAKRKQQNVSVQKTILYISLQLKGDVVYLKWKKDMKRSNAKRGRDLKRKRKKKNRTIQLHLTAGSHDWWITRYQNIIQKGNGGDFERFFFH